MNLPIEFQLVDAHHLDFGKNTFDSCRADRVFQHLSDREQVLAEMIRVSRPGARICAMDADWETLLVDAPDKSLTRKILHHLCDITRNGWSGRQLSAMFKKAGLINIVVVARTNILTDFSEANEFR